MTKLILHKDESILSYCPHCGCNVINKSGWQRKLLEKSIVGGEKVITYILRRKYACQHYDCQKSFCSCTAEESKRKFENKNLQVTS